MDEPTLSDLSDVTTLIFDLDGVITSEEKYWGIARLTVYELLESGEFIGVQGYFGSSAVSIRDTQITLVKHHAINSNWDLTFLIASLHLLSVLIDSDKALDYDWAPLFDSTLPAAQKVGTAGRLLHKRSYQPQRSENFVERFFTTYSSMQGSELLARLGVMAREHLGLTSDFFRPRGPFWHICYDLFQEWYTGKRASAFAQQIEEHAPQESTVIDQETIAAVLRQLHESGRYTLAIATGRPQSETLAPLRDLGLLSYFDAERIITYDDVFAAESHAAQRGHKHHLGKPHPFVLFKAMRPEFPLDVLYNENSAPTGMTRAVYIGDSASDGVAARKAGCLFIGVLSGIGTDSAARQARRHRLEQLNAVAILEDIRGLPELLEL